MPLHPNARRCTHIQITGHRCGSPALKQEYFCYFHTRMIKGVQTRVDSQIHPIALIENAEAIQAAIMHMIDAVLKGTIDNKRANIVLKALHIAVRNSRNVYFDLREDHMVREVPNYAKQYLTEHPELNATEPKNPKPNPPQPNPHVGPDALVRAAEQSSAGSTHNPSPQNQPKENASLKTENLNPLGAVPTPPPLNAPKKKSHPERTCTSQPNNASDRAAATAETAAERRHNAAHGASRGNSAKDRQAPKERKKRSCDPHHVESEPSSVGGKNFLPSPKEKACTGSNRESEGFEEMKKLEASIEGAMRGNWRDLRTVFNAVGLFPRKAPTSHKVAPGKKV